MRMGSEHPVLIHLHELYEGPIRSNSLVKFSAQKLHRAYAAVFKAGSSHYRRCRRQTSQRRQTDGVQ